MTVRDPFESFGIGLEELPEKGDRVAILDVTGENQRLPLAIPLSVRKRLDHDGLVMASELQLIVRQIDTLHERMEATVGYARDHGLSWAAIGWCVGLTGEGARKKWGETSE